jgi:hypothetical protein
MPAPLAAMARAYGINHSGMPPASPRSGRLGFGPAAIGGPRLIPPTVPEGRMLLQVVSDRLTPAESALAWSDWRRAHQHLARECHYKKWGTKPP